MNEDSTISDFWIKSELILLSKEENNIQEVENTRTISIIPSTTKAFKAAIINNSETVVYKQRYISKYQRGFTPRMSTLHNINDLFDFCQEIKETRRTTKRSMTLVFIDMKRTYDSENRNILLKLFKEAN